MAAAGAVISKAVSSSAGRTLYNSKGDASPGKAQEQYTPKVKKGYAPKPGERTLKGYVNNNVSSKSELSLKTNSAGFNKHDGSIGGTFKRFGVNSHGGISPHVHQPYVNIAPNGNVYGNVYRSGIGIDRIWYPNTRDVKQLYQYLFNGKYH